VTEQYQWVKLTDSALFSKSYNFQLFSIRDTIWAFHPEGNFYSIDGSVWNKSALSNSIHNLAFLDYVIFKNAVYGLGHFEGNIEKFSFTPQITRTTDLKSWQTLAASSNLPDRFFYHPFDFEDKLWIIGGMNKTMSFSDIWNSHDAVHWTKVKDNLPFGKRDQSNIVFFKNRLFLLNNDVWSSENGIDWIRETAEMVKGEDIFGYAPVVYDDRIWLLGCNRNGKFTSKVLSSSDGKNWTESDAPWSPRGGIAACVHKGRIIMTGGKYGGQDISHPEFEYSNDVWSMEKISVADIVNRPVASN
jgi:hypothetical protein